jgi:hypothetical protein
MSRLSLAVLLAAILLGCATLPSAQSRMYTEPAFGVAAASTAACGDVGAVGNLQLRIAQDMETMSVIGASATYTYTILMEETGAATQTTLVIKDASGAYAGQSVYDEFWAALEAHLGA